MRISPYSNAEVLRLLLLYVLDRALDVLHPLEVANLARGLRVPVSTSCSDASTCQVVSRVFLCIVNKS